jgi:biopolymer transport protein ExbB
MEGFAKWMSDGGIWMYIILGVSIISLGIVIERFIFLFFRYNINAGAFMAQIQKLVVANSYDKAIKLCNAAPSAALARVLKAGLLRANKGQDEIREAIEEATLEVVPHIQKRTQSLNALANISTLIGLLGTIDGMIDAFAAISSDSVPAAERQTALGNAISKAMLTTAFGLIVAIPTMAFHVFLTGVTKKIIDEIDLYGTKLQNLLTARTGGGSAS